MSVVFSPASPLGCAWRRLVLGACVAVLSACQSTGPVAPVVEKPTVPVAPPVGGEIPVVKKVPRLGLALGGGAARGFAHVGVLQVLEEAGIKADLVVGTSAGSLVAAFYASGKTGVQLQKVAETMEEATITDWTVPLLGRGMMRGDALSRYVSQQTSGRRIEELKMPLGIVATDLADGQPILFQMAAEVEMGRLLGNGGLLEKER